VLSLVDILRWCLVAFFNLVDLLLLFCTSYSEQNSRFANVKLCLARFMCFIFAIGSSNTAPKFAHCYLIQLKYHCCVIEAGYISPKAVSMNKSQYRRVVILLKTI
jgi:hypothetical protein